MGAQTGRGKLGYAGRPSGGRKRGLGPFDALDVQRLAPTNFFGTLPSRYFQVLRPLSELLLRFYYEFQRAPVYEQVPSWLGPVAQGNCSRNVVQVTAKTGNLRKESE